MKVCALAFAGLTIGAHATIAKDNTITKVVKILQDMLAKSKVEGDEERTIFAKFKCFCDDNELEKKESIEQLGKDINVLSSKIEELQGSTGSMSSEANQLRQDMMANENARAEAESIRNKEHDSFVAEEADMKQAIGQMNEAIETLSDVGADQTLGDSAGDHEKMMAGFSALSVNSRVKQALSAVSVFLNPQQTKNVQSFLQARAPFTGSYTSQSGQIVGTLKSMRDTFKENLATAQSTEKQQADSHEKLMDTLNKAYDEMSSTYDRRQEGMGDNDDNLATKKDQLVEAKEQKANDEAYLEKLLAMCEEKTKEYNNRKMLRANEDAAVAEAVAILNSDESFAAFGKTDATSTGATGAAAAFIQLRSRRVRIHSSAVSLSQQVKQALLAAKSPRVAKVASLIQAENIFDVVLKEITKMLELIEAEGKQDKENLDWCNDERTENNNKLDEANDQIDTLTGEIQSLTDDIEDPETGLKAQIKTTEDDLASCIETQKTETKDRKEANLLYQQDIKNLVAAESILKKAIKVLRKYYDDLEKKMEAGEVFLQRREDPDAPETFGGYKGQSSKGGDAISMLEFILDETKKEESEAHSDEENAQHDYEDSMADQKEREADNEKTLVNLRESLAQKEEDLLMRKKELKKTEGEKEALEKYLAKIKPGCDFITENFDEREDNRATETAALERAEGLIKDTPVYKKAMAEAKTESFGDCKEPCTEDESHVECKACMAKTSIPGYCAGHKDTPGC
jgi:ABC-type transporter Mla subunit MlaD